MSLDLEKQKLCNWIKALSRWISLLENLESDRCKLHNLVHLRNNEYLKLLADLRGALSYVREVES